MKVGPTWEILDTLESALRQLLVVIKTNPPECAFDGTSELVFAVEELCRKGSLPKAICFERHDGGSPPGTSYTRIWTTYPYDDAARGYIIERDELPTEQTVKAQQTAITVLGIWLGVLPEWKSSCARNQKPARTPPPGKHVSRTASVNEGSLPQNLSEAEQRLVDVVRAAGRRMTTKEILSAVEAEYGSASEGTTKTNLATLVRRRLLTNRQDVIPKGYGLPESE